jgi:two-component system, OmpR family, sensor histidine kinase BaeS
MRTIAGKLTLAFLLVGLTGAVLVAIIVRQSTRAAFDQFLLNREQQTLVSFLYQYYQVNGDWEGVGTSLVGIQAAPPRGINGGRDLDRNWNRFVLVGENKFVILSANPEQIGKRVADRQLENSVPLVVDGKTAGWLLLEPGQREWLPGSPEGVFLRRFNLAILLSALAAAALALILGGVLAFTLTRSLRELTEATVEIARGKFGQQVKVRSRDELGELATSFNQMSLDLERATQARRQMTSDIAHDLRSPLSVIGGYSEALSDGKLAGTPEVYETLYQETRHLNRLVEDLRTLSLADAGELPLVVQSIAPGELLKRVANSYRVKAESAKVALRLEIAPNLAEIEVDVERMAQVLGNLMSNALRYTPEGGEIVLSAVRAGDQTRLGVHDNGAGIAPDEIPYIFERSYRGDKARQQLEGESGLGLAIARSLVEAQGGTIGVESTLGEGTEFYILL